MELVTIRKKKRPAGSLTWGAYQLADDAVGTWLYTPQGSTASAIGAMGERAWSYVGVPQQPGLHVLQLVPRAGWYIAHVSVHPSDGRCVSVDISTPPRLQAGEWAYEDLELDLVKIGEDQAFIEDEDEFAEACATGLISAVEAERAQTWTTEVAGLLSAGISPFDYSLWRRLEVAIELGLPSLSYR